MPTAHETWLAQTVEAALEPDIPICDPHHHFWPSRAGHDPYLLEDLLRDTGSGHRIVHTVFVECHSMYRQEGPEELRPVGETEFVEAIAARSATAPTAAAAGIVAYADLRLGAKVAPVLEAHAAASKDRLRGIRNSAGWDPSPDITVARTQAPGLLLDARFREGFACLQRYSLSFDAVLYHTQLPELVDLARAFPETTIILNHVGRPLGIGPYAGKRAEVFAEWQQSISAVAECPNVVVKVGGLGNPISGFDWHQRAVPPTSAELADAVAPYYLFCIEQFGVERCMFESNFPVDKASYSYAVLWNALKRLSQDFSPAQRAALFHDTAAQTYRLAADPKK
jgi:predicted TIM-barrel fold metal-dependent hydrolase